MDKKITIADIFSYKQKGQKITAVSCYDFTTAKSVSQTNTEMIIVGDSAAQLFLGFDSTLPVTMDFMVAITTAVRRGAPNVFLVADMPFLSYQISRADAIRNAGRFITEAGAQMVKIESTSAYLDIIKAVSNAGIGVMAHIGIKPQYIGKIGKFKAEATTAQIALQLITLADQMVAAGADSLLLEATTTEVAEVITQRSDVPVISCGSGPACDGQVLVAPDILGLTQGPSPKFAKQYDNLAERTVKAFNQYAEEVSKGHYPDDNHCYHMKAGELDKLRQMLKKD